MPSQHGPADWHLEQKPLNWKLLLPQQLSRPEHRFTRLAFLTGTLPFTGTLGGTCVIPTFRTDALWGKNTEAGMDTEDPARSFHAH